MRNIRVPGRVLPADVAVGVASLYSVGVELPGRPAFPLGTGSGVWEP